MIQKIAHIIVTTRLHSILEDLKEGWNNYSYLFYIGGISVILGGLFGVIATLSPIITIGAFIWLGRLHRELDRLEKLRLDKQANMVQKENSPI